MGIAFRRGIFEGIAALWPDNHPRGAAGGSIGPVLRSLPAWGKRGILGKFLDGGFLKASRFRVRSFGLHFGFAGWRLPRAGIPQNREGLGLAQIPLAVDCRKGFRHWWEGSRKLLSKASQSPSIEVTMVFGGWSVVGGF